MATATEPRLMTEQEFLALPEDGTHRELVQGHLIEESMTYRNRWHSETEASISYWLKNWLMAQVVPRGQVVSGEAGFRLRREPPSIVGIDVAYVSQEVVERSAKEGRATYDGAPVLAVEILSGSEVLEDLNAKIREYLAVGVGVVWIVDPRQRTVTVYRPDGPPVMFNETQELAGEPHLPGFRVAVSRLFE